MMVTTGIGYNVDKVKAVLGKDAPVNSWDLISPETREAEKLRRFLPRCAERSLRHRAALLGKDPNSTNAADCTGAANDLLLKQAEHPLFPLFPVHQRSGERRHLRGDRLVRRRDVGGQPRQRGEEWRERGLCDPERGSAGPTSQPAMPADAKNKTSPTSS